MKDIQCELFVANHRLELYKPIFTIFVALKEGAENLIGCINFCVSYIWNLLYHPFGDRAVNLQVHYTIALPLIIIIAIITLFFLDTFEGVIFSGFVISFLIDWKISKDNIQKLKSHISVNAPIQKVIIFPIALRSEFYKIKLLDVWRIGIFYSNDSSKDSKIVREDFANDEYYANIYDAQDIRDAYGKALSLSHKYDVPVLFRDGDLEYPGINLDSSVFDDLHTLREEVQLIRDDINNRRKLNQRAYAQISKSLPITRRGNEITIESNWRFGNYVRMLGSVLQAITKSIVLVCVINLLAIPGQFLNMKISLETIGMMQESLLEVIPLSPQFWTSNVYDLFEIIFVSFLYLNASMNISMRKLFRMTSQKMDFYVKYNFSNQDYLRVSLSIPHIQNICYLEKPMPQLIISDAKTVLSVKGFQTVAEFDVLLYKLLGSIVSMRSEGGHMNPMLSE
jgi:hypothetical protein